MASEVEVPVCKTKEEGLKHNVTSTGRMLGIVPSPTHGLFHIRYVDGRSGSVPDKLAGRYTGVRFAQEHLTDFVTQTWDIVAEQLEKSEAKARSKKSKEDLTEVAA